MKDCVSCGQGEHRLCAQCNRDMRRERQCPVCLVPLQRKLEGRRVVYLHPPMLQTCVVAEGAPWAYTATKRVYLVVAA